MYIAPVNVESHTTNQILPPRSVRPCLLKSTLKGRLSTARTGRLLGKSMTRIQYQNGKGKCPCGGEVAYDAKFKEKLPLGFGFAAGSTRFRIDYKIVNGWREECMACERGILAVVSSRFSTSHPAKINQKIAAARKEMV
jgi:hypothetical protein